MQLLIEQLENIGQWKQIMRLTCKNNKIYTSMAGWLTPGKLSLLKERFNKAYQHNPDSFTDSWIEHQMRAFNWILIAISSLKNIRIGDFGPTEWKYLSQIFDKKSVSFLRYETQRFLLQKKAKNKNWASEQNQLLIQIINKYYSDRISWNEVARGLFQSSNEKYFRTAKHCREHWFNYLDPSKKRGDWTREQDLKLLEKVQSQGKKWAKFGAELNRTQHSVKNRYNSIISKQKKALPGLRKEYKIIELTKKSLQTLPEEEQKDESEVHPIPINLKMSSQSMYNENRSQHQLNLYETQPKKSLDMMHDYNPECEEHIKHLFKEEEGGSNKNDPSYLPSFWTSSPKNLTPLEFSPSPFSFASNMNMNYNYYFKNFTLQIQRQNSKDEGNNN